MPHYMYSYVLPKQAINLSGVIEHFTSEGNLLNQTIGIHVRGVYYVEDECDWATQNFDISLVQI